MVGKFSSPKAAWQKGRALINTNEYVAEREGNKWKQDTKREERTEKFQKRTKASYEKVECSLVSKRETYKGKEDLRKSKILLYSQQDNPGCLGMKSSKREEPKHLKIFVRIENDCCKE